MKQRAVLIGVCILLVASLMPVQAQSDEPVRIIFMHHSTGANLIAQGGVREAFAALGYEFWDHGYNGDGLADPQGNATGISYNVPGDNTDPDGWYETFQLPYTDPPSNALSEMLQYDVIIFKSCFPSSHIVDQAMFDAYREYFLAIRDVIDQYPDKLFIPFTTPPLVPNETDAEAAARAREWAAYLTSDEYLAGHPNIFVFDFFTLLADEDGFLRAEYRADEWDSHPNEVANQAVGPVFVDFVAQAIEGFVPGEPSAQPVVAVPEAAADETTDDADAGAEAATEEIMGITYGLIDDFEGLDFDVTWWSDADEGALAYACEVAEPGYDYTHAMRITLDLPPTTYAGCGRDVLAAQGWAEADGMRFAWRSDTPGLFVSVLLFAAEAPYEAYLETPGDEWVEVTLTWDDFTLAEWADAGAPETLDPAAAQSLSFVVGLWGEVQQGTIWIDAVQLIVAEE